MSGLGSAPLGSSSLGAGVPSLGASPGKPATGEALYVDPHTRDYVVLADGNLKRCTRAQHFVTMAMFTVLDSSAVPGFGLAAPASVVSDTVTRDMEDQVRRALQPGVDQGLIAVVRVTAQRSARLTTRVDRVVTWVDLATQQEQSTPF